MVAFAPPASAAWTVKLNAPAVVGVPLKTPELFSVRLGGGVPATTVQVYGGIPPITANVCV